MRDAAAATGAAAGRAGGAAGRVVVVGSVNVDLVTRVEQFPRPGETLLGSDYQTHHGGKGANQAVAAARLGADVSFVGRVGEDAFGERLRGALQAEGIDTSFLRGVEAPSGAAFITVDASGQNVIVVSPGANARLTPDQLQPGQFQGAAVVVLQQEIPAATVTRAIELGKAAGATVLVNAAPAGVTGLGDLRGTDILVVNESEAATLLEREGQAHQPEATLERLAARFPGVIVTLGSRGVIWRSGGKSGTLRPHRVEVVDTTAAGDAFVGAVAARLAAGAGLAEAIGWGNAAGGLAVTRPGAQPSLPTAAEVMRLLQAAGRAEAGAEPGRE